MSKLYERLSSLTPLLQGKQVNYLPMMVGALRNQGMSDKHIKAMVEEWIKKLPVGDLGEKLYPKSMFDEYYIHKTNFYLGQLRSKSFEELFQKIVMQENDLSASYEFAGLLRVMYALKSEEELPLAEALAFLDLTSINKKVEVKETPSLATLQKTLIDQYEKEPTRKNLVIFMNFLTIHRLKRYLPDIEHVLQRYTVLSHDVPKESSEHYPTLKEIKEGNIDGFSDYLLMIMYDLLQDIL